MQFLAIFCVELFLVDDHGPIRRGSKGAMTALLDVT
jgi:hypothetical protein